MIVDVDPKFDLFQLRPGRPLIFLLLRDVVPEFSEIDDLADGRIRGWCDLHQVESHVGRINLYLLDTDVPENSAEDRLITAELYGGDLEMRMRRRFLPAVHQGEQIESGALAGCGCLTNPRQLLSREHVYHPRPANACSHKDETGIFCGYLADDRGVSA